MEHRLKCETNNLENSIIVASKCVEIYREHNGTWRMSDGEHMLCDRIGKEIADMLPPAVRLNPLHSHSAQKILGWIEASEYLHRPCSENLPDESKLYRKIRRIKSKTAFWTAFLAVLSLLWIFAVYMMIRAL